MADVYGITVFQKIHVYLKNGINWTTILVEDFIQDLREDVEFDGMNAQLDYEFKGALLEIDCDFE
ncbi:MAG: hypothetical protein WA126_01215 [Thermodesulfovibrionales bacterium]